MRRLIDLVAASLLLAILGVPMTGIALAVRFTSPGPALHWSRRVGQDNSYFLMPKFRTMYVNTPDVATHLLQNTGTHLTPIGPFLRAYSLDEFPQLFSVLKGDMSFIGPRPALHNQDDLIALRTKAGVHHLKPGITGWAQVNGRDDLSIPDKVRYEEDYLNNRTVWRDITILFLTLRKVIGRAGISH